MAMQGGIQLVGKNQVLDAYKNMDVEVWSIFCYKNLMAKGNDIDMLDQFLTMIGANNTQTMYTIKFYEDLTDPKQVKEKTEASGSLNFRLTGLDQDAEGNMHYRGGYVKLLEERIGTLEKLQLGEKDNDGPQTLEDAAIGLLSKPAELIELLTVIKGLFTPNAPAPNQGQPYRATVGHISQQQHMNSTEPQSQEQLLKRLQSAVTILEENDPQLVDHLEKLAMMAQDKPAKFKMLLSMLENF